MQKQFNEEKIAILNKWYWSNWTSWIQFDRKRKKGKKKKTRLNLLQGAEAPSSS